MKKLYFLFLLGCIQFMAYSQAVVQDSAATDKSLSKSKTIKVADKPKPIIIPKPEFINQPYYYDRNDNRLIKLETSTAQLNTKKKTLGLKGSKQFLSMQAPSSRSRFTSKNNISFIIKTSGDVIDLTSYIKLYKFIPIGQSREVTITSKEGVLNNKDEQQGKLINMSVKPLSKDNYMIQFADNFEAGEYGFVWFKNMELKEFSVFTFGIDWKSSD